MSAFSKNSSLWQILLLAAAASCTLAETKQFTSPANHTYVYDYVPARDSQPTILLLHGFPSSRRDWQYQIDDLSHAGFGVIAPDNLGFGDSDKPLDVQEYNLKVLAGDVDALLSHEGLETVVGVSHDWGANVLSAGAIWHPKRFEKLAFLSVAYTALLKADIDAINAQSLENFGYTQFGYWYFFNSYDAVDVISDSIVSFFNLVFPEVPSLWRNNFAAVGSARAWLSRNTTTSLPTWRTEADKAAWLRHYSSPDAMHASLNIYRSILRGVQAADEAKLTDADRTLQVPVLNVGGSQDLVSRGDEMAASTEPWASKGFTQKTLDAGHWLMLEKREEVSSILADFAAKAHK